MHDLSRITGRTQLSDNLVRKFNRDRPLTEKEIQQCDRELAEITANIMAHYVAIGRINGARLKGQRTSGIREVSVPAAVLNMVAPIEEE